MANKRILTFLIVLYALTINAQTGSISGVLLDEDGTVPMTPLLIEELNLKTYSNLDGEFHFEGVKNGTYKLSIKSGFHIDHSQEINLSSDSIYLKIILKQKILELETVNIDSRTDELEKDITGSQITLTEEDIKEQVSFSNNLNEALVTKTPGLGPSTQSASSFGQSLRGRDIAIFMDGVPQSTPLRGSGRILRSVEAYNLSDIKILRGASAVYGYGATGGVIDLTTKTPKKEGMYYTSFYGTNFYPTGDINSIGYRTSQQIEGGKNNFNYLISTSYEKTSRYNDGEGDVIPVDPIGQGGTAENDVYNLFFKFVYFIDDNSVLDAKYIFYQATQDSHLKTLPGIVGEQKATPFIKIIDDALDPGNISHNASLRYRNFNIFKNTDFSVVTYLQSFKARFNYTDFFDGQSFIESDKIGSRIDFKTDLKRNIFLSYGLDLSYDKTSQEFEDDRIWMPKITQQGAAPFIQMKTIIKEDVVIKAGARFEINKLDVPTFFGVQSIDTVQGKQLTYTAPLFNISARLNKLAWLQPALSFSQGFSVADVGRTIRGVSSSSLDNFELEPLIVNNFEFGLHGKVKNIQYHSSLFLSTSRLGNTYEGWPDLTVTRAPERVYGYEFELNYDLTKNLKVSGNISLLEGKVDLDNNGSYETYLNGTRIAPTKIAGIITYKIKDKYSILLQNTYIGNRDRFPDSKKAYEGSVKSYNLIDASISGPLWKGIWTFAVQNLLNTNYFANSSQFINDGSAYVMGKGINCSLSYIVNLALIKEKTKN